MAWDGLRKALAQDPEGVAAVLRTVRKIPISEGRAASSPPLWVELARWIEVESGWRPDALHPQTGASGLIQWMPRTAAIYGVTPEQIRAMSRADQAPLVERYTSKVAQHYGGLKRAGDLYVAGAYPVALTYPADKVIAEQGSAIWQQNPAWRDRQAPGEPVTVRRLLELGQPPPMPEDLRGQVLALVPDLETAYLVSGSSGQPAPAASAAGASGSSGQTSAIVPVASGASGQQGAGGAPPAQPAAPVKDKTIDLSDLLLWGLILGALAGLAGRRCL
jgi:hypothetical protein